MTHKDHQDPRIRRTRILLQDALLELLKTKTMSKIQIKEIAAQADVSRHAFYSHFHSKEELLFSYIDDVIFPIQRAAFKSAIAQGEELDLLNLLIEIFRPWGEHHQILKWVMQVEDRHLFMDRLRVYVAEITQHKVFHGQSKFPNETMETYFIEFITGGVYMLLYRWSKDGMQISAEEIGHLAYQFSMISHQKSEM